MQEIVRLVLLESFEVDWWHSRTVDNVGPRGYRTRVVAATIIMFEFR